MKVLTTLLLEDAFPFNLWDSMLFKEAISRYVVDQLFFRSFNVRRILIREKTTFIDPRKIDEIVAIDF